MCPSFFPCWLDLLRLTITQIVSKLSGLYVICRLVQCIVSYIELQSVLNRCILTGVLLLIGSVKASDKVWKGAIEIPNLSEEHDAEDVDVSHSLPLNH